MRRSFLLACAAIGLVALLAMFPRSAPVNAPSNQPKNKNARGDAAGVRVAPTILPTDPLRGFPTAPLTIIEFGDLTCPSCVAAEETLTALREHYGPQLRIIWKDFPILNRFTNSRRTHIAARCAQRQGRFWEYHDAALAEQPPDDAARIAIAERLALEQPAFTPCLAQEQTAALVDAGIAEAARLELRSAPAFAVNGEWIDGHPTVEDFRNILDRALR